VSCGGGLREALDNPNYSSMTAEERAAKRAADREEYRRWADEHAPDKAPPEGSVESKQREKTSRGGAETFDEPTIPVKKRS